jgi:hypothetical protein
VAIDEMLMRVYYLYEKSSKKYRELEEVVQSLRQCLEDFEMPVKGENMPLRECGTKFVSHKIAALGRPIERF